MPISLVARRSAGGSKRYHGDWEGALEMGRSGAGTDLRHEQMTVTTEANAMGGRRRSHLRLGQTARSGPVCSLTRPWVQQRSAATPRSGSLISPLPNVRYDAPGRTPDHGGNTYLASRLAVACPDVPEVTSIPPGALT